MKLVNTENEFSYTFSEDMVNIVVIENGRYMRQIISDLYDSIDKVNDNFILSDKLHEFDISNSIDIEMNFFNLDINNKKVISSIIKKLGSNAYEDNFYEKTNVLLSNINSYAVELLESIDYPLDFSEISVDALIKELKINCMNDYDSFVEKIINYIKVCFDIRKLKVLVFINLLSFLDLSEKLELFKEIIYNKYKIIFIEQKINSDSISKSNIEELNLKIIDKDLCEL